MNTTATAPASLSTETVIFDADIAIFSLVTGPLSSAFDKHAVEIEEEYDVLGILAAVASFDTIDGRIAYCALPGYSLDTLIGLAEKHRI